MDKTKFFLDFLTLHECRDVFMKCLMSPECGGIYGSTAKLLDNVEYSDVIAEAFHWDKTSKFNANFEYWSNINTEWKIALENRL